MTIQSLSTHPHAVGKSREVLQSIKHFRSFKAIRHCCMLINIWLSWELTMLKSNQKSSPYEVGAKTFLVAFYVLKQIPIYFNCSGKCCNTVMLLSSSNILKHAKLKWTFNQHLDENIITEFSFLDVLFLTKLDDNLLVV